MNNVVLFVGDLAVSNDQEDMKLLVLTHNLDRFVYQRCKRSWPTLNRNESYKLCTSKGLSMG